MRRVALGDEAAAFVREQLSAARANGKILGGALTNVDLAHGSMWSFLPESHSAARTDLASGFEGAATSRRLVADWIGERLATAGEAALVFLLEDAVAYPDAPVLRATPPRPWLDATWVGCDDCVYWVALGGASEVQRVMRAAHGYPRIGVIGRASALGRVGRGATVTRQALERSSATAQALVVGAWDDESLIIWEATP